ncbi:zinc finger protein 536 isoform X1 [Solea senegalensis]|uniref:Zinc finger protein 536 isoform X1 n=1 Tax=Solea senegalensis TaxID=28829 RepID=A0AAV6Q518_SOLSE|nr:zinc finger protein 536 isoform X1 [Solea senegalensis]
MEPEHRRCRTQSRLLLLLLLFSVSSHLPSSPGLCLSPSFMLLTQFYQRRLKPEGQRPFKCSYCPYSASQKGNLKTHVLCVHRMPFDNTRYPDRRFKRSRAESDVADKNLDDHDDDTPRRCC